MGGGGKTRRAGSPVEFAVALAAVVSVLAAGAADGPRKAKKSRERSACLGVLPVGTADGG